MGKVEILYPVSFVNSKITAIVQPSSASHLIEIEKNLNITQQLVLGSPRHAYLLKAETKFGPGLVTKLSV